MKAILTVVHLREDGKTHLCDCFRVDEPSWDSAVITAVEKVRSFTHPVVSATLVRENEYPEHVFLSKVFQPSEWQITTTPRLDPNP